MGLLDAPVSSLGWDGPGPEWLRSHIEGATIVAPDLDWTRFHHFSRGDAGLRRALTRLVTNGPPADTNSVFVEFSPEGILSAFNGADIGLFQSLDEFPFPDLFPLQLGLHILWKDEEVYAGLFLSFDENLTDLELVAGDTLDSYDLDEDVVLPYGYYSLSALVRDNDWMGFSFDACLRVRDMLLPPDGLFGTRGYHAQALRCTLHLSHLAEAAVRALSGSDPKEALMPLSDVPDGAAAAFTLSRRGEIRAPTSIWPSAFVDLTSMLGEFVTSLLDSYDDVPMDGDFDADYLDLLLNTREIRPAGEITYTTMRRHQDITHSLQQILALPWDARAYLIPVDPEDMLTALAITDFAAAELEASAFSPTQFSRLGFHVFRGEDGTFAGLFEKRDTGDGTCLLPPSVYVNLETMIEYPGTLLTREYPPSALLIVPGHEDVLSDEVDIIMEARRALLLAPLAAMALGIYHDPASYGAQVQPAPAHLTFPDKPGPFPYPLPERLSSFFVGSTLANFADYISCEGVHNSGAGDLAAPRHVQRLDNSVGSSLMLELVMSSAMETVRQYLSTIPEDEVPHFMALAREMAGRVDDAIIHQVTPGAASLIENRSLTLPDWDLVREYADGRPLWFELSPYLTHTLGRIISENDSRLFGGLHRIGFLVFEDDGEMRSELYRETVHKIGSPHIGLSPTQLQLEHLRLHALGSLDGLSHKSVPVMTGNSFASHDVRDALIANHLSLQTAATPFLFKMLDAVIAKDPAFKRTRHEEDNYVISPIATKDRPENSEA